MTSDNLTAPLELVRTPVPPPPKTRFTLSELRDHDFPAPKWAVPELLPEGLTILAGPPKSGKSYLALQIAGAVAQGGWALGRLVEARPVLYLALEDSGRRIKERIEQQGWLTGETDLFQVVTEWPRPQDQGPEKLAEELEDGGYGLVVLDTLGRLFGASRDMDKYAEMTDAVGYLQAAALKANTALLTIHHHKKAKSGDLVEDGLGSIGINAAADAIAGLYRKGAHWQLQLVGRDLEERTLELERCPHTRLWQLGADRYGVRPGTWQGRIVEALREKPGRHGDLKERLGIDGGLLSRELRELEGKGAVLKGQGGVYEVNTHN